MMLYSREAGAFSFASRRLSPLPVPCVIREIATPCILIAGSTEVRVDSTKVPRIHREIGSLD